MPATHGHIVERPEIVMDGNSNPANRQHGCEEANGCEEQSLTSGFSQTCVVDVPQTRRSYKSDQRRQDPADDERQNPECAMGPRHSTIVFEMPGFAKASLLFSGYRHRGRHLRRPLLLPLRSGEPYPAPARTTFVLSVARQSVREVLVV